MAFFDLETWPRALRLLISGFAYGSGLLIGNIFSFFLFDQVPSNWFLYGNPVIRLVTGVLLAFLSLV